MLFCLNQFPIPKLGRFGQVELWTLNFELLNFGLGGALQFASGRGHSNHGTLQRASAKAQGTTAIAVCAVGSFEACWVYCINAFLTPFCFCFLYYYSRIWSPAPTTWPPVQTAPLWLPGTTSKTTGSLIVRNETRRASSVVDSTRDKEWRYAYKY